jgi:diacylglycerol kinase family enzyme
MTMRRVRASLRGVARRSSRNGAVVACGGDGTINAVAQRVLPTLRPFGLIPSAARGRNS